MLSVVKRKPTREELKAWAATVGGFVEAATRVDGSPTRLYGYQREFCGSTSRFRAVLKARQTGFSFVFAAEGLAKAHLKPPHTAIYVSYNLEDAKEKVRFARMLYETMPAAWRLRLLTDNKTELEFGDRKGRRSRLISNPCREPRGKGRADVYLDELAFYRNARRIYTAAVPLITRGGGTITVASTPLGKSDIFHEIVEGERERYRHFERFRVPWWRCPEFCTDVADAERAADGLPTAARVERYGTEILRPIFESMDGHAFGQEYECRFIDEATAYVPWELILAAAKDADELPAARSLDGLDRLDVSGPLYAGYDVGRRRNASELVVVEHRGGRFLTRCWITLEGRPFREQRELLTDLLASRGDLRRLCIDATGMGMQLAEELAERHPTRVEGVTMTAPVKEALAPPVKIAFEDRNVWIPTDRDFMAQVHSVRKTVTAAGNVRYDSDHDERHHADKFWALALALHAASKPAPPRTAPVPVGIGRSYWRR